MMIRIHRERLRLAFLALGVMVVAIGSGFFHQATAFSGTNVAADDAAVVLELFTSEGCSSCPPADALLSELGSSTKGVIPLAYHVDYWNHLGWTDPLSSPRWSDRQSAYTRAMNLDSDYTPQMVISGQWQAVGSDRSEIARGVTAARAVPSLGRVSLQTIPGPSGSRKLQVKLNARMLNGSTTGPLVVMVAIYENRLVERIHRGENGGRQITYDYTVRSLLPAFQLSSAPGASVEKKLVIDLDPSWSLEYLGVAAFIQDTASLRIVGAAAEYPVSRD
jgi:hypothetical protein